ncbi:hypothetical protein [Kitasatospora sp. CB02891]|uniref:hypothetical protein n=1 Tax=Kitasatospora sp. CB02891 TaxID=2020329 RepID=UPI000C277B54|nr:hypothetical protein [Kitasatospora sp. CB02891]
MDPDQAPARRRQRSAAAVVAVLIGCGLLAGLYLADRGEHRAAPPAPAPGAPENSGAPAGSATSAAPGPALERIVLERAPQGKVQVIDLDLPSGRSQLTTDEEWQQRADGDRAHIDLLMVDAATAEFEVPSGDGRIGGVLAPNWPVTRETCLRAANSGSLTRFRVGTGDRSSLASLGLQRGSAICVVTDSRQLVQLSVTDQTFDNAKINTTGRLTVAVTPLGPVTD